MKILLKRLRSSAEWEFIIRTCEYTCVSCLSRIFDLIYRIFRYEKAIIAMAKQSVTLEVLSYHASASLEDAQRLKVGVLQLHTVYFNYI